jgi:hypothetical protein
MLVPHPQAGPGTQGVAPHTPPFMPAAIHARGTHSPRAPPFRALCAPRPPRAPCPARRGEAPEQPRLRGAGAGGEPGRGRGAGAPCGKRGAGEPRPRARARRAGAMWTGGRRPGRLRRAVSTREPGWQGAGRGWAAGTTLGRSLRAPAAALGGAGARGPRAGRGGRASAAALRVRPEDLRKAGVGGPAEPTPFGGRPWRGRRAGRRLARDRFPSVGRAWARACLGHLHLRPP